MGIAIFIVLAIVVAIVLGGIGIYFFAQNGGSGGNGGTAGNGSSGSSGQASDASQVNTGGNGGTTNGGNGNGTSNGGNGNGTGNGGNGTGGNGGGTGNGNIGNAAYPFNLSNFPNGFVPKLQPVGTDPITSCASSPLTDWTITTSGFSDSDVIQLQISIQSNSTASNCNSSQTIGQLTGNGFISSVGSPTSVKALQGGYFNVAVNGSIVLAAETVPNTGVFNVSVTNDGGNVSVKY